MKNAGENEALAELPKYVQVHHPCSVILFRIIRGIHHTVVRKSLLGVEAMVMLVGLRLPCRELLQVAIPYLLQEVL